MRGRRVKLCKIIHFWIVLWYCAFRIPQVKGRFLIAMTKIHQTLKCTCPFELAIHFVGISFTPMHTIKTIYKASHRTTACSKRQTINSQEGSRLNKLRDYIRQNNGPQRCPHPNFWILWICYLIWRKRLSRSYKVKDAEMGRVSWIIQVGPM
jgi:hypothetical protein